MSHQCRLVTLYFYFSHVLFFGDYFNPNRNRLNTEYKHRSHQRFKISYLFCVCV